MSKKIKIKLIHSAIGRSEKQKQTIKGLGFRRLNQIVEREDTPAVRGMIQKITHLVQVLDS